MITFAQIQKEGAEEYQELFDFFASEHDLVLTIGEMEDIVYAVTSWQDKIKNETGGRS